MKIIKTLGKALFRSIGYYPIKFGGLSFKCAPYHIGFWREVSSRKWEPRTCEILSRYLKRDSIFYDIGSWIGPTTIYAAKICKKVICFEPDPVAYQYLLWNISLNKLCNVFPNNIALAEKNSLMRMASFGIGFGDSKTSLLKKDEIEGSIDVLALTLNTWVEFTNTEAPTLIKIDIEGGEFALIPTIKDYLLEHKPIVFISTHSPFLSTNKRKEEMRSIIVVMSVYKTCLNSCLEPISIDELVEEDALGHFNSYIFLD